MWDNRTSKKNPRQPDYKCKDRDGCDGAIWLDKKNSNGNGSAPNKSSNGNGSSGSSAKDDYWNRKEERDVQREERDIAKQPRVERQHSQDMALRHISNGIAAGTITKENMPDTNALVALIDFFQADISRTPGSRAASRQTAPAGDSNGENKGDTGFEL